MENFNEYVTRSESRTKGPKNELLSSKNENTKIDPKPIDIYWILKNLPADICLVAQEKCFRAHKLILENHCDNLNALLKPNSEFIYINSSQYAVIYLLLHVYMPPLKITICNLNDAIEIANELGCVDLKIKCRSLTEKVMKKSLQIRKKANVEANHTRSFQQQVREIFKLTLMLVSICEKANFMNEYNEFLKVLKQNKEILFESSEFEKYFLNLSRTDKRNILQWLVLAKRQETREKRIAEIVDLAHKEQKPKQFTVSKKSK
jgi:hypothetical protein